MQSATPRRTRRTIFSASIALASAAVVTGCGGSSVTTVTTTVAAQRGHMTPKSSNPDVGSTTQAAQAPAHARAKPQRSGAAQSTAGAQPANATHQAPTSVDRVGRAHVQRGRGSGDTENNVTGNGTQNPCRLVSMAEAQTVIGVAVSAQVEAPLGPTCIYQLRSSKASVTMAVETMSFTKAIQHMAHKQSISVSGHHAYCGTLGRPMLFVQLAGGQVLNVTAPCGAAARLAHVAVSRLSA